jgi:hypothetical protein
MQQHPRAFDDMTAPVLFLVFNRPDTTGRVFQVIREARPCRLFVAADGPRPGRDDEADRCAEVSRIATAVDWPCEVKTLFREHNLGCKRAVSSAIDWFFTQVDEGIVIEDDCLPDPSFFRYCTELLERWRDDERVMGISGDNFIGAQWQPPGSYYFSRFPHIWGWASWRRAWVHYDVAMRDWPLHRDMGLMKKIFPASRLQQRRWASMFDRLERGDIDTWDYQWSFACWKRGGLTCIPAVNLVTNIGFGPQATHTHNAEASLARLPRGRLEFPLSDPPLVAAAEPPDAWSEQQLFSIDESWRQWGGRIGRSVGQRVKRTWRRLAA